MVKWNQVLWPKGSVFVLMKQCAFISVLPVFRMVNTIMGCQIMNISSSVIKLIHWFFLHQSATVASLL